jgi:hypothetical protein
MSSTELDDRESFENVFHYFLTTLRVLVSDAVSQCHAMGTHNTPWEIQRDMVSGGLGSLRLSARTLSWEQAEKILDIVAAVRRLPREAIAVPNMSMTSHVGCMTAMGHPAWEPLRSEAAALLVFLEPAIQANTAYIESKSK